MSSKEIPIYRWFQENANTANNDTFSTSLFPPTTMMDDLDWINLDLGLMEPTPCNLVENFDLLPDDPKLLLLESDSFIDEIINTISTEDILNSFDVSVNESLIEPPTSAVSIDSSIEKEYSTEASLENEEEIVKNILHSLEYPKETVYPIEISSVNEYTDAICLGEEYQNYLIFEKQPICGIYYLSRNKPYLFSLYYNKDAHIDTTWTLHISLESAEINKKKSPKKPETLTKCTNFKHSGILFSCNDMNVHFGDSLQIPLCSNRINRELCINFFCNNSCSSMYSKSKLNFRIIDSNDVICFEESYSIHVSERPGRDERDLLKDNVQINNVNNFISRAKYLDLISDPQLINKDIPKLIDYTNKNCKFEMAFDNYEFSNGINFSSSIKSPISFKVTEANVPFPDQSLYLRCMIVDPISPESPILCKNRCGTRENLKPFHILSSNSNDVQYEGTNEGVFADERLSILFPLKEKFSLYFKCLNSCFLDRNRKYAGLIVILENAAGEMFARRHFKFAIVSRPNRNKLYYDDDDDDSNDSDSSKAENKKRKSSESLDSPKKRKHSRESPVK